MLTMLVGLQLWIIVIMNESADYFTDIQKKQQILCVSFFMFYMKLLNNTEAQFS